MLSLIQYEVVDHHHWLTLQQFTDVVAISQMTPGPIGINSATYVGYAVTQSVLEEISVIFAFFWSSGMVRQPQLHMVERTLERESSTLSFRLPA